MPGTSFKKDWTFSRKTKIGAKSYLCWQTQKRCCRLIPRFVGLCHPFLSRANKIIKKKASWMGEFPVQFDKINVISLVLTSSSIPSIPASPDAKLSSDVSYSVSKETTPKLQWVGNIPLKFSQLKQSRLLGKNCTFSHVSTEKLWNWSSQLGEKNLFYPLFPKYSFKEMCSPFKQVKY